MKKGLLLALFLTAGLSFGQNAIFLHEVQVSEIPPTKASGEAWDSSWGNYKPDVFVTITENYTHRQIKSGTATDFIKGKFIMNDRMLALANDYVDIYLKLTDYDKGIDDKVFGINIKNETLKNGEVYAGYKNNHYKFIKINTKKTKITLVYSFEKYVAPLIAEKKATKEEAKEPTDKNILSQLKRNSSDLNGVWKSSCGADWVIVCDFDKENLKDVSLKKFVNGKETQFYINKEKRGFTTSDNLQIIRVKDKKFLEYTNDEGFKCKLIREQNK